MLLARNDSGQVALILVLVMTVIASAAVSLAGRTTVETRVQEINIDSSQAQMAAESGLEQALRNAPTGNLSGNLDGSSSFNVTDNLIAADQGRYNGLKRGETVELFMAGASGNPASINIYWSPSGSDTTSERGIFVTEVRPTGLKDYAFKAVAEPGSGFIVAGSGAMGFTYGGNVPIDPTTTELRITVLGGDINMGFAPSSGTLAPQLRSKTSVGVVTRGEGTTEERIQYGIDYRQSVYGEVPEIFEYALFSGQSISQ